MAPDSTTCFAIDIGNSGLRVAEIAPESECFGKRHRISWFQDAFSTSDATSPEHAEAMFQPGSTGWLDYLGSTLRLDESASSTTIFLASVRRDATQVLKEFCREHAIALIVLDHSMLQIDVDVDRPEQVGIDRLLAATAAHCLARLGFTAGAKEKPKGGYCIAVQAGSAVTVDLVRFNADTAQFQGGAIMPGIPMMLKMLGQGADQLPQIQSAGLVGKLTAPGKNTEAAMRAGACAAVAGGLKELVSKYRQDLAAEGEQFVPVIISGGDGRLLSTHLSEPVQTHPDLVLQGLVLFAKDYRAK
ncbi:MAG: type III pantothenate kinase [Planctomycetota bacterium]